MAYLITRMPSTGAVTNIGHTPHPIEEVRARWAGTECVRVLTDEEFAQLPRCPTCNSIVGDQRCSDCP